MRLSLFAALPLCAVLSACATGGTDGSGNAQPPSPPAPADPMIMPIDDGPACNADVLPAYEGKVATTELLEEIKTRSGARHVRVGKPGMAMTMDFRQDRVTIFVDADNRIQTINCG